MTIAEPAINPRLTRNIFGSISSTKDFCSGFDNETTTITRIIKTNVIDMRSRKGKSGNVPFVQEGRNFKSVETGIVSNVPVSAAVEVVRFQKNPIKKIASTPGEINPTYS